MTITQSAAEEFRKMDEPWVNLRFGSDHDLPCKDPHTVTCAMPKCQKAGKCELSQGAEPPFTLCERTVQACIDALRNESHAAVAFGVPALESLLPKPDRAKELVEEWKQSEAANDSATCDEGDTFGNITNCLRWLITEKGAKL